MDNLYIKKGQSVLLFFFHCEGCVNKTIIKKILEIS